MLEGNLGGAAAHEVRAGGFEVPAAAGAGAEGRVRRVAGAGGVLCVFSAADGLREADEPGDGG